MGNGNGAFGIGYKFEKLSPNISFGWASIFDRGNISGEEIKYSAFDMSPKIGLDLSLSNKPIETYISVSFGTFFWRLPNTLNYSFFTETGIGLQKLFGEMEFGSEAGIYYRVVNYDRDDSYRFSNHKLSQYVKVNLKYYFIKKRNRTRAE
ncbi:MAG: hypothetical protein ACOC3T_04065 [Bacteroidota bacterium]